MPIIRKTRPYTTAFGVLNCLCWLLLCWLWSCGAGSWSVCTVWRLEWKRNLMAHGDAREEKWRGKRRMEWVVSSLALYRNTFYPALLPLMPTTRLPAADWTDTPADINGLVRFAGRPNLVSARVPSHSVFTLPFDTDHDPAPHNHSQHNECRTPYAVIHGLVLLMMDKMMPETCWDRCLIINIGLDASCWFLSLYPTFIMHGHKNLKVKIICYRIEIWKRDFTIVKQRSSLWNFPLGINLLLLSHSLLGNSFSLSKDSGE